MIDLREHRKSVVAELERCKTDLEPLKTGEITLRSLTAGEDWKDVTADAITNTQRVIATYEMIIADLDRRIEEKARPAKAGLLSPLALVHPQSPGKASQYATDEAARVSRDQPDGRGSHYRTNRENHISHLG